MPCRSAGGRHGRSARPTRSRTPGPGFDVEWLPKVQGTLRKTFPFAPEAGRDADGYAWYELGEYDISALQKIHHPTMHRLSLYIEGDVEIERIEIAKVK